MKKAVLESIEGVEIYPIISLLIFFTLFIGVLIFVFKMTKKEVNEIASLPLESNDNDNNYEDSHEYSKK